MVAGMRQQVGVGGKSGPSLQASKGGAGGPHPPRERAWGAEEVGGARSEEADRTDWTKRLSARPGSCRQRHGEWARNRGRDGAGAGRAQNSPLTSHLPARPSLEPGAGPAVLAPPPPRLPSGSRRQCAHGRADTGPTAAHSRARRRHRAPAEHACYSRLGARCPQSLGVVVAWPVCPQA